MTFSPSNTVSPFVPQTTFFPNEFNEFRVKFLEIYPFLANCVNTREIAFYQKAENLTGQQWFSDTVQKTRQVFRKVFEFNDSSLVFNHEISNAVLFTHIYGGGTDGTNFFPIPYVDATAANNQIQVDISSTQVTITKGGGTPPTITNAVLVLEYLKN